MFEIVIGFVLTLVAVELFLRLTGFRPWTMPEYENSNTAGNLNSSDLIPAVMPLNGSSRNGISNQKPEIWVFDCFDTHGKSSSDVETYPWYMQARLPEFRVANYGGSTFSTVQSLFQLRRTLEFRRKPKYVIMAYSHLHDIRNTSLRSWKKRVEAGISEDRNIHSSEMLLCGVINKKGELIFEKSNQYKPIPLMHHSALVHSLEIAFNTLQERFTKSYQVSRLVMEEFQKTCEANGIKLIMGGLDNLTATKSMLIYCKREGISSVVLADESNDFTQRNSQVNKKYADRLVHLITRYERKLEKKRNRRIRAVSML